MIKLGAARKFIVILANTSLLFNSFVPFLLAAKSVYAQEAIILEVVAPTVAPEAPVIIEVIPEPTVEITPEVTPTIESTPTPEIVPTVEVTPEPTVEITPEVTPTIESTPTPEITPTPIEPTTTPEITPEVIPTVTTIPVFEKICLTDQQIKDTTNEEWIIDDVNGISETKSKVQLGVKYVYPQESKVSVTFKCLPKDENLRTSLKIQKVKTADLNLPDTMGSVGEYAYDITTGMKDGDFSYDVTLPKPADSTAEISYIEKSIDEAKANLTFFDINKINSNVEQSVDTVKATDVDHFTIFIVTKDSVDCSTGIYVDGSCYSTIQTAIDNSATVDGSIINVKAGTYNEKLTINKSITLQGADKTTTIIDGEISGVVVIIKANNATLKGFTVKNSGTNISTDAGIGLVGVSGVTVEDNIITNNVTGIAVMSSSGNTIKNNNISNSARYGIVLEEYPLAPGVFSTSNTILGNTMTANARDGIYVGKDCNSNIITSNIISGATGTTEGSSFEANGIYFWKSASNTVTNNTVTSNTVGYGIEMYGSKNNTITGNEVKGNLDGFHIRNINETDFPGYSIRDNNISSNKIYDNTRVNLYSSPNFDFNIENNWWGSPNRATIESKLASWDASGDVINGTTVFLDYTPWCTNSECTIFSSAPTTESAADITSTDATLNGTNGDSDASGHSFWVSLAPFVTTSPTIPSGVYSTADLGSIAANADFSAPLTSVTGLPTVTPNTTYHFVTWSLVDGTWYPGEVLSFITADKYTQADFKAFDGVDIGTNSYTVSSGITATYTGNNTIKLTGYASIVTPWFGSSWTTYNYVTVGIKLSVGFTGAYVYQTGIMRYDETLAGAYKMSSVGDGSTPLATAGAALGYLDYSFAANSINTKKDGLVKLMVIWNVGDEPEYFTIDINNLSLTLPDTTAPNIPSLESPADGVYIKSTGLTLDWSDSIDPSSPVTYYYQSSYSSSVGAYENSLTSPIYNVSTGTVSAINASGSGDNLYYWQVKACDALNNCSDWSGPWAIHIDNTAPLITLGTYSTAPTNQNITITATTEAGSTLNVGSTTFTANGSFDFIATDAAGNTTTETVTITNIDKTNPNTPVHISPSNDAYINYNDFWFDWDDVSDAVSYEIQNSTNLSVNGNGSFTNVMWTGDYQKIQPTNSTSRSVGANGTWYWQVRAVDSAGNKSTWSTPWKVTIDKTVPSVVSVDSDGQTYNLASSNPTIKITFSEDISNMPYISVHSPAVGNQSVVDCGDSDAKTFCFTYSLNPEEVTTHTIYISDAKDIAGNTMLSNNNHTFIVDRIAPIFVSKTTFTGWYKTNQTSTFNYSGSSTGNDPTCEIITEGTNQTCSITPSVCDTAGNCNITTITSNGANIDKTAPSAPSITTPVANGYITSPMTQTFVWTASTDPTPGSGLTSTNTYQYQIDNNSNFSSPERDAPVNTTTKTLTNPLPDGTYYVRVKVKDRAGNYSSWSPSVMFTVDTIAPTIISKTISDANGVVIGGYLFDKAGNTATATVEFSEAMQEYPHINIKNQTDCGNVYSNMSHVLGNTWKYNWTIPSGSNCQGWSELTFDAIDLAGNSYVYLTSDRIDVRIDNYGPNVNIYTPSSGTFVKGTNVRIEADSSEDGSGVAQVKFYYYTSDVSTAILIGTGTYMSGITYSVNWDTTPVTDGEYYLTAKATDTLRNETWSENPILVTVDNTAPSSTINGGPNNGTIYSSTWNGFISGTASDLTSGVKEVQLTVQKTDGQYWNGSAWQVGSTLVTAVGATNWTYQIGATLADGTYTIKSHAIDNAGNTENTYTLTIVLDKTINEVALSIDPAVGDASNGWYKTQPTITLTQTDVNFVRIEYQWNSQTGTWTVYSTPFKLTTEGAHVLYYRAIDKANNISTVGVKNIAWDQTDLEYGPQNISANPNPTSGSTSKIKWDFAKDNTGIDKYEVQWSLSGLNYSKTVGTGTSEVEIDQLTEGSWTVKVVAFDRSGRTKDGSIDLNVDRSGPIAPVLTLAGTSASTATLFWNAIADATDYIVWYGNSPGSRIYGAKVGNVTSYTVGSLGAGNYYFIVKAVDAAQNQGAESNEVNTGLIVGAAGVTSGTPADGFTEEVLGTTTTEVTTPTPTLNPTLSDVLGISANNINYLWWLLLILPFSLVLWLIIKKRRNN